MFKHKGVHQYMWHQESAHGVAYQGKVYTKERIIHMIVKPWIQEL